MMSAGCDSGVTGKDISTEAPSLSGMMVWEKTGAYGRTELAITDFSSGRTVELSTTWTISSISDPCLSPDGKLLVFSGVGGGRQDIFLYDVTTGAVPESLTGTLGGSNTSPVFSSDGKKVTFMHDGQFFAIDMDTKTASQQGFMPSGTYSCPTLTPDGKKIIYVSGESSASSIGLLDLESLSTSTLYDNSYAEDSSPAMADNNAFWFVSGNSPSVSTRQIHKGYLNGQADENLPFNSTDANYTNPTHVSGDWLIVTSDRTGGSGGEDLWIANAADGAIFPMSVYGSQINSDKDESNAWYCAGSVNIADPEDGGGGQESPGDDIVSDTERPVLSGRLVYHNYTSYDDMDSRMYIYDFASDTRTEISTGWTTVTHPMNGHFSPDGKSITFMGIGNGGTWDVFIYDIESGQDPVNLTGNGDYRDEDPKFSYDGTKIAFKRNDRLATIDVASGEITILSSNDGDSDPYSMPYWSLDGSKMVFGGGAGQDAYIGCWDMENSRMTKLYDRTGVVEYYPITIDEESFYYSAHVSATDNHDQLYKGYWDRRTAVKLAFNRTDADYSDACVIGSGWLVLCSTRSDSHGGYDLYIAHETSGAIYSLDDYNTSINSSKNELGASYTTAR